MGILEVASRIYGIASGVFAVSLLVYAVIHFLQLRLAQKHYQNLDENVRELYSLKSYSRRKGWVYFSYAIIFALVSADAFFGVNLFSFAMLMLMNVTIYDFRAGTDKKLGSYEKRVAVFLATIFVVFAVAGLLITIFAVIAGNAEVF